MSTFRSTFKIVSQAKKMDPSLSIQPPFLWIKSTRHCTTCVQTQMLKMIKNFSLTKGTKNLECFSAYWRVHKAIYIKANLRLQLLTAARPPEETKVLHPSTFIVIWHSIGSKKHIELNGLSYVNIETKFRYFINVQQIPYCP